MKRIFNYIVLCSLMFCVFAGVFAGCSGDGDKVIDNTEGSKNHDKIYLYNEGNVPYDSDGDTRKYVFITPYLAAHPTGGAVVVFPGGGYNHLSNATNKGGADNDGDQKESSAIAEWYNAQGISVFVVNYRTTSVDGDVDYRHILADGMRAVRYVRANADKFYVNADKIAVQGYSAGGHLASVLLTKNNFAVDDEHYVADEIDAVSAKANAAVLCYAVTSLEDGLTHKGTAKVFSGGDEEIKKAYSSVLNVTADTSPCFLWCHESDGTVSSQNTYEMAAALQAKNVECEMHVFDDNGTTAHGVGVAQDYAEAKTWPSLATEFLKNLGF